MIHFGPQCTCIPGWPNPNPCPVHFYTTWPPFTTTGTKWFTVTPCRGRHCKHDSECAQPNS